MPVTERFNISTPQFQGPLDVLLELVEKRKLFINEISLAEVADGYISYVKEHTIPMYDRASYIAIAATLLLIKSRSLLPDFHLSDEEEHQVEDLTRTLERYAVYKSICKLLFKEWGTTYLPLQRKDPRPDDVFAPSRDLSLAAIHTALAELYASAPPQAASHPKATVYKTVSIEVMIERIRE
ncbi:MAG: segregation and condensation protein segregation and condensation protein, partial [Candidatus Parcubacteria bacterium]